MSYYQINFFSTALMKQTMMNVIVPNDTLPIIKEGNKHYDRPTKVLYALHGFTENMNAWLFGSQIQELATKYNLAIVMPHGENSFYLNQKGTGYAYANLVGVDIANYLKTTFGLSASKEDTAIIGISMGGFGAVHTGLQFSDQFGKIIAFSSAMIADEITNQEPGYSNAIADYDYYVTTFGDLSKLETSENNPKYQIKKLIEENKQVPPIFMACGTEDFLLEQNRDFHKFLTEQEVDVTYYESKGVHDWKFWNEYLEPAIQWMTEA